MNEVIQDKDNTTNHNSSDVKRIMIACLLLLVMAGGAVLLTKWHQSVTGEVLLAMYVSDAKDAESAPDSPEKAALINAINKAAADDVLTKKESTIIQGRLEEFRAIESKDTN